MHRLISGRHTAVGDLAHNAKAAWNGASKLRLVLDVLLPEWVEGFSPGFQPVSSLDSIHKSENGEYLYLIGSLMVRMETAYPTLRRRIAVVGPRVMVSPQDPELSLARRRAK